MVNAASTVAPGAEARLAERRLILSYAPRPARAGLAALLDLDDALAGVLRHVSEPVIAQMRLTWWHDALIKLDTAPPPAQPVLTALAEGVVARGVAGASLASLVEGWEALIEGEPDDAAVRAAFAVKRGACLFALMGRLIGADDPRLATAGQGWALADLSRSLSNPNVEAAAAAEAKGALDAALAKSWPRALRALGALALRARMDLEAPRELPLPAATPGRVARLAWHRMTGR